MANENTTMGPPAPPDAADTARWCTTSRRRRMLSGIWSEDAETHLHTYYNEESIDFLPPAEISNNPFLSLTIQQSTLYDDPFVVDIGGVDDVARLVTPQLLPLSQNLLTLTIGLNESLMRVDYREDGGITYRVVPADMVTVSAPDSDPANPNIVVEYRVRKRKGLIPKGDDRKEWTRETWDISDLDNPRFTIEAYKRQSEQRVSKEPWIDVTEEYAKNEGKYPYFQEDGKTPIMPYVLKHRKVSDKTWMPNLGSEVVAGTLTVASLWTDWLGGVRDGTSPIRGTVNLQAANAKQLATAPGKGTISIGAPRNRILQMELKNRDQPGSTFQYQPASEPKSLGEAIAQFAAQLAIYYGINPADVMRSSSTSSGYALTVSREGLRQARKRLVPPMRIGDQRILWTAGLLLNAYDKGKYPTTVQEYRIIYPEIGKSGDEVLKEIQTANALLEVGAIGLVDYFMKFNPNYSREEAFKQMILIRQENALLEDAVKSIAEADDGDGEVEEIDTDADAGDGDGAGDDVEVVPGTEIAKLGLNGAQMASILSIVEQFKSGQLDRKAAVELITQGLPTISVDSAEVILGQASST